MLRKSIALFITLFIVFTTTSFAASDISSHWAEDTIQKWLDEGKAAGYEDGNFHPNKSVSRAEFVKLINAGFSFAVNPVSSTSPFSDVEPSDWFFKDVMYAYEERIIIGFNGAFLPNNKVTRQEAARIIANIIQPDSVSLSPLTYKDRDRIADWANEAVTFLTNHSVIKGYPDLLFKPQKQLTRAEALVLIDKAVQMSNKLYGTVTLNNAAVQEVPIQIIDTLTKKEIGTTKSDVNGHYSIAVKPGSYMVVANAEKGSAAVPIQIVKNKLNVLHINLTATTSTQSNSVSNTDTTAPVTTYNNPSPISNGTYIDKLEIVLTASDNLSGVNKIEYRINGGPWINYTGPFIVYAETTEKVEYRSVDNAGNSEVIHFMDFNNGTVGTVSAS